MEFVHGLDTKPTSLIDLRDSAELSSLYSLNDLQQSIIFVESLRTMSLEKSGWILHPMS